MNKKILSLFAVATLLATGCDKAQVTVTPKDNNNEAEQGEPVHSHVFDETQTGEDGYDYAVCSICSFKKIIGLHEHTFSKNYRYDSDYHWQPATCHPGVKRNYGEHEWGEIKTDTAGKKYHQCIVCRYKAFIESSEDDFANVTQFETPIDIHTDVQQKFLEFSDNTYDKMPQNSYPDGTKNISDPLFTKIRWNYDGHNSDVTYSISISQNEDMKDSFTIMGDNYQEIDAYNLYLGKNYYSINATYANGETHTSKVYSLTVKDIAPRNIYAGARMTNCRDIGGRRILAGGSYIRQGLLYRTCGNGYNQDGKKIKEEEREILENQLKLKTEINLHNNTSYNFNLDTDRVYNTLMDYADGSPSKHAFSRNAESVKNVFEILAK